MRFYEDAFSVEGLILGTGDEGNGIGLFGGEGDPWDETINLPVGSVYFKTNGSKYRKSGSGNAEVDWTLGMDPNAGGGGVSGCIPFYRADGVYDSIPLSQVGIPFYKFDGERQDIPLGGC